MTKTFLIAVAALLVMSHPTCHAGILYGVTGSGAATSSLYTIDTTTGAATLIGATGFSHIASIDFDPISGLLYGIENDGDRLLTIDTTTGSATSVATLPGSWGNSPDMSFSPGGTLYTWSEASPDRLNTVDLVTGVTTEIGPNSLNGSTFQLGLDVDSNGTIYIKNGDGSIYSVDSATGQTTFLINIDPSGNSIFDNVLAFDPSDVLYTLDRNNGDSDLYTVDLSTGLTTLVGATGQGRLAALAFAPDAVVGGQVPEPGSILIWSLLGLAGGVGRRRRKAA